MSDDRVIDTTATCHDGWWSGSRWCGMSIGPEPLKHEPLTGRDGLLGIVVRECAACGRRPIRVPELLVRPAATYEWRTASGQLAFSQSDPPEVAGWITSCGHVVWAGLWELVFPAPGMLPRWESRSVPFEQRDRLRRAAFSRGED